MANFLIPVLIIAGLGLLIGLILAILSIVMAVPVDEKVKAVEEALPGVNCGACGYSGCTGYAEGLAKGKAEMGLCSPGGNETNQKIAEILGIKASEMHPQVAVVHCFGNYDHTKNRNDYSGVQNCKMASLLSGGPKNCYYGCLGFGDCAAVCDYGAISICNGIATIHTDRCKACKKCVAACPKHLISMVETGNESAVVLCKNKEKGATTRKECSAGCIGCMKCMKTCQYDAITVKDNLASVDSEKCTGCGECVAVCPVSCINMLKLK